MRHENWQQMKQIVVLIFMCCGLIQFTQPITQLPKRKANVLVGVFDGRTPCRSLAKQVNETVTAECTKIKWRLTLYKDSATRNPSTYELLGFVYKKDNPRVGKWYILKGTKADPQATVYQLDQPGGEPLFLQKGDDNVLFFLDREKNLLVGNRDFSYTLNRVVKNP